MPSALSLSWRPAAEADAAAVRGLVRAAYAKWVPVIGREPKPMTADYALAIRDHQIDLFHHGERLVALIETMPREDHLWIENIAVDPGEQGRGVGRHLLAHAEARAAAAGLRAIRLLTNGAFAANVVLYERQGYVVTRRDPYMGGITVHMAREIGR